MLRLLICILLSLSLSVGWASAETSSSAVSRSSTGSVSTSGSSSSGNAPISSGFTQSSPLDGRRVISQSADPSYILSANDFIQIMVYQEDDLSTITRISSEGVISFPLIGNVKVGGMTVAKATDTIRSMLMDGYIRDPQVSVTLVEYAKRRFSVLGQVQRPGSYEMPQQEKVTLLQAIALAGGYTRIADPGKVTVKRLNGEKKETVFNLNAKAMANDTGATQFIVAPDDTITVGESIF